MIQLWYTIVNSITSQPSMIYKTYEIGHTTRNWMIETKSWSYWRHHFFQCLLARLRNGVVFDVFWHLISSKSLRSTTMVWRPLNVEVRSPKTIHGPWHGVWINHQSLDKHQLPRSFVLMPPKHRLLQCCAWWQCSSLPPSEVEGPSPNDPYGKQRLYGGFLSHWGIPSHHPF